MLNDTIVQSNSFTTNHSGNGNILVYIRTICDEGYYSDWSEVISAVLPNCDISLTASVTDASCIDSLGSVSLEVLNSYGEYTINYFGNNPNALSLGAHAFSVIDEAGCTDTIVINIDLEESSDLALTSSANSICSSDEAILTATSDFASYQWFRNGELISNATSSTLSVSDAGDYHVEAIDINACQSVSDSITISVIEVAPATSVEIDNILSTSASLDWDNVSPTGIYNIRISSDGGSNWSSILNHIGSSYKPFKLNSKY